MSREFADNDLLNLTEIQLREILRRDADLALWLILRLQVLAKAAAQHNPLPSTPSSQIPPYKKDNTKPKDAKGKKKRPGSKKGHKGSSRKRPPIVDETVRHTLEKCPDCGAALSDGYGAISRVIEDIEESSVKAVEHVVMTHYCTQCKKSFRPKVDDALPKSTIGLRALILAAWMHYSLGETLSQIVTLYSSLFQFSLTGGGLVQQWQRVAEILEPWYEQIGQEARDSAVLHADETGWRENGKTVWLWCFATTSAVFYLIDPKRSAEVVVEFLCETFAGTLVTDFYAAYSCVSTRFRQMCLVHLLRELKKVDRTNDSGEWLEFRKTLRRILKDAIKLACRTDRDAADYISKRHRIERRLNNICEATHEDADCVRLAKRLRKYQDHLLTFLYDPQVPFHNNFAEREIRPAVLARKNSFHNMSERGAVAQAIFMTVFRTLKLRGLDPRKTVEEALRHYVRTGTLPPLPTPVTT